MISESRAHHLWSSARTTATSAVLGMTGIVVVIIAVATQFATHRAGIAAIGGAAVAFLAQLRVISARSSNST